MRGTKFGWVGKHLIILIILWKSKNVIEVQDQPSPQKLSENGPKWHLKPNYFFGWFGLGLLFIMTFVGSQMALLT